MWPSLDRVVHEAKVDDFFFLLGSRSNLLWLDLDLDLIFCLISLRLGLDFIQENMAPSFAKIVASLVSSTFGGQAHAHFVSEAPAPTVQLVQASLDEALKFSKSALICQFNGFWL